MNWPNWAVLFARMKGCKDPVTGLVRTWCGAENPFESVTCGRCGNAI